MTYKSPGPLDQNYAGPWDVCISNYLSDSLVYPTYDSQPAFGFFLDPHSIIYDEKRKALHALAQTNTPYFTQNMTFIS